MNRRLVSFFLGALIVIGQKCLKCQGNDFPSLIVANATLAILLDHEYLDAEYEKTLKTVRETVEKVLREDLHDGGLIVKYFSWTQIDFKKDFTAVISITDCKRTWQIFYETQKERLFYTALTDPDCARLPIKQAIMIPILTIGEELPQILLDIRTSRSLNWKTAILIHDDIFDRDTISRVVLALSAEPPAGSDTISMSISMFKISINDNEPKTAIANTLTSLATNYIGRNFIVIVTQPQLVIEVANDLGMLDTSSQWIFIVSNLNDANSNISKITKNIGTGGNIALAINTTNAEHCVSSKSCHFNEVFRVFILALAKMIKEEEAIYKQISDEEWEAIRLTKKERKDSILDYVKSHLSDSKMCPLCASWIFKSIESWGLEYQNDGAKGNQTKKNLTITEQVAYWEPTFGLIIEDSLFPHISHGFRNRTLPVGLYHNPPWQILRYNENGDLTEMDGVTIYILKELADKLNFTYEIIDLSSKQNNISITFDDSNRTNEISYESTVNIPQSILDSLSNNKTESTGSCSQSPLENVSLKIFLGAAAVTINEEYMGILNFTRLISVQSYSLLISRPKELSRLYLFAAPFSADTWICLIVTLIAIGPLLYAFNFFSPYNEHFCIAKKGGLYRIGNCFWYIYGALLQQGGMYLPKSDSARLIIGTWWLVVLVVVTTYCGNLVAYLTFPKIETPITTVAQLLNNQKGITWGIRKDTLLESYMEESENENYKRLKEGAQIHSSDMEEVIQNVKLGKHIYIDWKSNLKFIMKQEFLATDSCDFSLSTEEFLDERIALVMPLNSPYLNIVNREIYRMLQMGFIQKWLTEFLPTKDRCSTIGIHSTEIENHTVNLNDMQGCFFVLIAGILASFVIIFCECIFKKKSLYLESKIIKPFLK